MIRRAVYNKKQYKIIDSYNLKYSNNEVTFNDIKIDFTGGTISDIPYKYQEIKIVEAENEEEFSKGKVIFTGYLDEIDLSDMKQEEEEREMTLTLLSPLKMATKRIVSLIGTYKIEEAIRRILQPLINDGFIIKEINIPDGQITVNFVLETVENCMNNIGFKRNIFWYINENKEISVNSVDYMFGKDPEKYIGNKDSGLINIQPYLENVDYANIINFKNIRLIYSQENNIYDDKSKTKGYPILSVGRKIKKGDIITFDNPIILGEKYLRDYINSDNSYVYNLLIYIQPDVGGIKSYSIGINEDQESNNYDKYLTEGSITFSDSNGTEGEIVLQRDSFYTNLITGFKWNVDCNATIEKISSDTALRYTTMKFMYSAEINKMKGIISRSGQIEKTIDYQKKWTTLPQLISYARSLMMQNSNVVNQVTLKYDKDPFLKIGDIVKIENNAFYINGKFAVKSLSYTYKNDEDQEWNITLKATDFISSYIDLFRPVEVEENENKIDTVILSEFLEENIEEKHETQNNIQEHTLNFNLEV